MLSFSFISSMVTMATLLELSRRSSERDGRAAKLSVGMKGTKKLYPVFGGKFGKFVRPEY